MKTHRKELPRFLLGKYVLTLSIFFLLGVEAAQAYGLSTREAEKGRLLQVRKQPELHSEYQGSQASRTLCQKQKAKTREANRGNEQRSTSKALRCFPVCLAFFPSWCGTHTAPRAQRHRGSYRRFSTTDMTHFSHRPRGG